MNYPKHVPSHKFQFPGKMVSAIIDSIPAMSDLNSMLRIYYNHDIDKWVIDYLDHPTEKDLTDDNKK